MQTPNGQHPPAPAPQFSASQPLSPSQQPNGSVVIDVQPGKKNVALEAAAASSANQLEEMKKEIAELEAQLGKGKGQGGGMEDGLATMNPLGRLLVCVSMVMGCYLTYGVLQEWLMTRAFENEEEDVGFFVSLLQFIFYTLFGLAQLRGKGLSSEPRKAPFSSYLVMGAFQVCCMGLANVSVEFLNYPTHILFKSAKPVPNLLLGACYLRRKYANIDYTATLLMIAGMALFVIADDQELDEELELKGFILVTIALLAEVTIVSVQEGVVKEHKSSQEEIIFYTHLTGCGYLLLICLVTGELSRGLENLYYEPHVLVGVAVFSLAGYFGATALKNLVKYWLLSPSAPHHHSHPVLLSPATSPLPSPSAIGHSELKNLVKYGLLAPSASQHLGSQPHSAFDHPISSFALNFVNHLLFALPPLRPSAPPSALQSLSLSVSETLSGSASSPSTLRPLNPSALQALWSDGSAAHHNKPKDACNAAPRPLALSLLTLYFKQHQKLLSS